MIDKEELYSIILDFIHTETGWGNPLKPYCEYEGLFFREIEQQEDGSIKANVKYTFDEDGFSQYDKSHHLEGQIIISPDKTILSSSLEETYTGPATTEDPYRSKKSD
ncbi:MAG: hypothetical protein EAX90_09795 [Candidatus Heimdallarchaeota archaeon]|nr:hypothetical protein [Candidatus Heimdallarchaeota archaeon]